MLRIEYTFVYILLANHAEIKGKIFLPSLFRRRITTIYLQFETGDDGLGDIAAQVVRDIYMIDAAGPPVLAADGFGEELRAFGGIQEVHADLLGHGGAVDVAGGSGEGEIDQGQHRAAHEMAFGVLVTVGQGHAADGAGFGQILQDDAVLRGITVVDEKGAGFFQGLKYGHREPP